MGCVGHHTRYCFLSLTANAFLFDRGQLEGANAPEVARLTAMLIAEAKDSKPSEGYGMFPRMAWTACRIAP